MNKYKKYDWTQTDYDRMFYHQKGLCAVCGNSEVIINKSGEIRKLAVDHNHSLAKKLKKEKKSIKGSIRSLLCYKCNRFVIGNRGDRPGAWEIYLKASNYLKLHEEAQNDI